MRSNFLESLPEQWEAWISGLQWQFPRRAHVLDDRGNVRQITTLPMDESGFASENVEALRDVVAGNYSGSVMPRETVMPSLQALLPCVDYG